MLYNTTKQQKVGELFPFFIILINKKYIFIFFTSN